MLPPDDTGGYHVDVPGDDVEQTNYLTYYADDETRALWQEDFVDTPMPERKYPAYVRLWWD